MLAGAAYRDGPDGPYTDKRFLEVVEKTFYSDGLPKDGVMRPTAAELAFVELGVKLPHLLSHFVPRSPAVCSSPVGDTLPHAPVTSSKTDCWAA